MNVAQVPVQYRAVAEALAANVAGERLIAGVPVSMDEEVVRGRQNFSAVPTLVARNAVAVDLRANQFLSLLRRSSGPRRRPGILRSIDRAFPRSDNFFFLSRSATSGLFDLRQPETISCSVTRDSSGPRFSLRNPD